MNSTTSVAETASVLLSSWHALCLRGTQYLNSLTRLLARMRTLMLLDGPPQLSLEYLSTASSSSPSLSRPGHDLALDTELPQHAHVGALLGKHLRSARSLQSALFELGSHPISGFFLVSKFDSPQLNDVYGQLEQLYQSVSASTSSSATETRNHTSKARSKAKQRGGDDDLNPRGQLERQLLEQFLLDLLPAYQEQLLLRQQLVSQVELHLDSASMEALTARWLALNEQSSHTRQSFSGLAMLIDE